MIYIDIEKLHPDHRQPMTDVLAMRGYTQMTDEKIEQIYNVYLELNKIPKKDWDKQSTRDKLKEI